MSLEDLAENILSFLSSNTETILHAEQNISNYEKNEDYPRLLIELLEYEGIDQQIRLGSSILLKNYLYKNWRKRSYSRNKKEQIQIKEELKLDLKKYLLTHFIDENISITKQLITTLCNIIYIEFPREWITLDETFINLFEESANNLVITHQISIFLKSALKKLASKTIPRDRRAFIVLGNKMLPLVTNLLESSLEGILNIIPLFLPNSNNNKKNNNQNVDNKDLPLMIDIFNNLIQTLRWVVTKGLEKDNKNKNEIVFQIVEYLHQILDLECSALLQSVCKLFKFFRKLIYSDPTPFTTQPDSFKSLLISLFSVFNKTFYSINQNDLNNSNLENEEKFFSKYLLLRSMLVLIAIFSKRQLISMKIFNELLNEEQLQELIEILLKKYLIIDIEDLDYWNNQPESYFHEDYSKYWKVDLNPCTGSLIVSLNEVFPEIVPKILFNILNKNLYEKKEDFLLSIKFSQLLFIESILHSIGLCSYLLYKNVNFVDWFQHEFEEIIYFDDYDKLKEIKNQSLQTSNLENNNNSSNNNNNNSSSGNNNNDNNNNNNNNNNNGEEENEKITEKEQFNIFFRRLSWLIGNFIYLIPIESKIIFYDYFTKLFLKPGTVLQLTCVDTLQSIINDEDWNIEGVNKYLNNWIEILFYIINDFHYWKSKCSVLNVLNLIIKKLGNDIIEFSNIILEQISILWKNSHKQQQLNSNSNSNSISNNINNNNNNENENENEFLSDSIIEVCINVVFNLENNQSEGFNILLQIIVDVINAKIQQNEIESQIKNQNTNKNGYNNVKYAITNALDDNVFVNCLQLWRAILLNSSMMENELFELFPYIFEIINNDIDNIPLICEIIEGYLIRMNEKIIKKYHIELINFIYKWINQIIDAGILLLTHLLEILLIFDPKLITPLIIETGLVNEMILSTITQDKNSLIINSYYSILSRIFLINRPKIEENPSLFISFLNNWLNDSHDFGNWYLKKASVCSIITSFFSPKLENFNKLFSYILNLSISIISQYLNVYLKNQQLPKQNYDSYIVHLKDSGDLFQEISEYPKPSQFNLIKYEILEQFDSIMDLDFCKLITSSIQNLENQINEKSFNNLISQNQNLIDELTNLINSLNEKII
ncbi:importin-11 [Anaeramoeba flamelloides]|uniref:Importin-11 n=1 Tax=Anaeramoeba flamelloides TaxID=1746091 RepID=A0AAV7Z544_9EUKA|nr:importin-11 [Anaeramoeba flamelloides]